jgi:hypothetical protein
MSRDIEEKAGVLPALSKPDDNDTKTGEIQTIHHHIDIDVKLERSYLRKLDFYLLPLLSLMYLFNAVDRVRNFKESKITDVIR